MSRQAGRPGARPAAAAAAAGFAHAFDAERLRLQLRPLGATRAG